MRRMLPLGLAIVLVAVPATVAADEPPARTGPYVGTVGQDETRTHAYDNNPTDGPCAEIVVDYTVYLAHQPATDTLGLSIAEDEELATQSEDGRAVLTFQRGYCAAFTLEVTGLDVEEASVYEATVCRGPLAPLAEPGLDRLAPLCVGTIV